MSEADAPESGVDREAQYQRVDQACDAFEAEWQGGRQPSIESYLADTPEPERSFLLKELLHVELEYRSKQGHTLALEDYRQRFPGHSALVRAALDEIKGSESAPVADPAATLDYLAGPSTSPPTESRAPDVGQPDAIGKYQVIERLGSGGQADVFRALHPHLPGRDVVIKWFRHGLAERGQSQLLQEGQVLAHLDDAGIVRIYDVDICQGRPYMVLEHIAGLTLRDHLNQGQASSRQSAALVAELAGTLARVHRHGVLHRDLKPANILIDGAGQPRLLDFGLAWMSQPWAESDRPEGEVSGTFEYMAPEQASGQANRIGPGTDIFGLGAILYHLLTGRPPYRAANRKEVWAQARKAEIVPPRQLNKGIPWSLERICQKALAADPDRRYASAGELEKALRGFLRRRLVAAAVAGGFLLVAFVAAGIAWWPTTPRQAHSVTGGLTPADPAVDGVDIPKAPAPPLKGYLDVFVWEASSPRQDKFEPAAHRQGIRLPQAVPLSPRDWVRIEARLSRPAYVYVVWIDTEGKATPIYPWQDDDWNKLPPVQQPRDRLSLPEKAGDVAPLAPGPAGIETLLLLVRDTPLADADNASLPGLFTGLPRTKVADVNAAAWFEGGDLVTAQREPDRGPIQIGKAQAGSDSVLRLQALLKTQLQPLFRYSRSVCFGNAGK
jgi:serine/threonine-protein kinase